MGPGPAYRSLMTFGQADDLVYEFATNRIATPGRPTQRWAEVCLSRLLMRSLRVGFSPVMRRCAIEPLEWPSARRYTTQHTDSSCARIPWHRFVFRGLLFPATAGDLCPVFGQSRPDHRAEPPRFECHPKRNTVHLTRFVAFCMGEGQEATGGAYGCGTPSGFPDHGLHQSWRNHQDISSFHHRPGAFEYRDGQCSPARSSGSGGCLFRDRSGAVHAVILSRSIALFAGGNSVAARSIVRSAGGRQVEYLSGAHPTGVGASAAVAR